MKPLVQQSASAMRLPSAAPGTRPAPRFVDPPETLPQLHECTFYHTIDLPGLGTIRGQWDLRPGIKEYFGDFDFDKKRVLEIGTASGFNCFEMERRGAEVTAFDLDERLTYDPKPGAQLLALDAYRAGVLQQRNGFWLSHRLLKSRARFVCGHANYLPEWLGDFDVGVMANVLQHLQDPVGAIMQLAARCRALVITEGDWLDGSHDDVPGLIYFMGPKSPFSWYQVKPSLVRAVCEDLGFTHINQTRHYQRMMNNTVHHEGAGPTGADVGTDGAGMRVAHFTITAVRPA